ATGIIGLGLIGGSIAKALHQAGEIVFGSDSNEASVTQAVAEGIILPQTDWRMWIHQVDQIVIATPLEIVSKQVQALAQEKVDHRITVVDVSSVKAAIADAYAALPASFEPLLLHPMAGRERQGYSASCKDLFQGFPCAVVPLAGRLPQPRRVAWWMQKLGMHPVYLSLERHDWQVAQLSHVPYLVAAALLVALPVDTPDFGQLAGSGIKDTTRVGGSRFSLWEAILKANHQPVAASFHVFAQKIAQWDHALQQGELPGDLHQAESVYHALMQAMKENKEITHEN
ncbi:MAG: prephenate dehydrogenase/arogenate dehydrogenase family protein, partial [Firmicutes bacterium]|nr:prephenate dehydrogenase/arogenate dehydrogenase family protein [Bacillota bacterium]